MSLRIEPLLTQACYIIGCSEKLKNVSETRWIWNVPLFINTIFFAFVLVPIPKYSATEICWRRCEKGHKSLLAFLEGVSAAVVHRELKEELGQCARWFSQPARVREYTCVRVCIWQSLGGAREGGLWMWLQVITGFLSLECWQLIPSKLQAAVPPLSSFKWQPLMSLCQEAAPYGRKSAESIYFLLAYSPPSTPFSSWREKKAGGLQVGGGDFFQINNATKGRLISDMCAQGRVIKPPRTSSFAVW